MTPQDAPAGPVLGEEARSLVQERLFGEAPAWCADVAVDALEDHVAALLSSAREEGREEGRGEERERIRTAAKEWCRRCRDLDVEPLQEATVILWGKLLPSQHLGPRCDEHAAEAVGWDALRPGQIEQMAAFDLRPFRRPS